LNAYAKTGQYSFSLIFVQIHGYVLDYWQK